MKVSFVENSGIESEVNKTSHHSIPMAEVVFESEVVNACNISINSRGATYASVNPLTHPEVKLYEIVDYKNAVPYPTNKMAVGVDSEIGGCIGIRSDKDNNLWILDMVKLKFIVWDTTNSKLLQEIPISEEVTHPNSFLQDFVIDEKNKQIIITDMTYNGAPAPAFIVYDMVTRRFARMGENIYSTKSDSGNLMGLNGIAIDDANDWIYFGAVNSHKLFRVPTSSFANEEKLIDKIEFLTYKPYSDGMALDDKGNVYIANVEDNTIGVANKYGYKTIATLPKGQTWPSGLSIPGDGYVYATVDHFNKYIAPCECSEETNLPFLIVRTKLI